jgi:hypothetical protein
MIIIQLPFDIENPDMQNGFEEGRNPNYQAVRPASDTEMVSFIQDFIEDSKDRLAYNIGFLFGLFQPDEPTDNDNPVPL